MGAPEPLRFISYMTPGFPEELFRRMADAIDAELELRVKTSGPPPGDDPFGEGLADVGWICGTSYVDLALAEAAPTVDLAGVAWVPDDPDSAGRPVYFGDVIVRADSRFRRIEDLAGARIGCNDAVSLSGNYAVRIEIRRIGHDPDDFADLVFTGSHNGSIDLVLAGDLDAATVDSVVRLSRARRDPAMGSLRIIERLGPYPTQPAVVRVDLDRADRARVRAALLALNDDPDFARELDAAGLVRLAPVDADHCAPVADAMELL